MSILNLRQSPLRPIRGRFLGTLLLLLAALALSACGAETPEPSATPTKTLRPTFTPTSAAVAMAAQTADAAATEAARATATPTDTPVPPTDTPVPTDTPAPPTDTPAPPTAAPPPVVIVPPTAAPPVIIVPPTAAPTQPPPPPASGDAAECAALGGDGCKFHQRGGPTTVGNGGGELKLTLAFIHSGRNNEAQSSYFPWVEKEGVGKLPIPDSVRSWSGEKRSGPSGLYNYEYKLGLDALGGSVAGCYVIWVLDGNGQRDSLNYRFCVPDGQGEVWIEFDQA